MRTLIIISAFIFGFTNTLLSQSAPAADENIPFLVTFGKDSKTSWGDDDFCQVFFFVVPASQMEPIYFRIYDPDAGGSLDEPKGEYNTKTSYSLYGGNSCWTEKDAQSTEPIGNYKSGVLLAVKTFGIDPKYDGKYYTIGPINPFEGEYVEKFDGRVFKIVTQGESGDDGNLYRFFLSVKADENKEVEGGNIFTYEYTFRLPNEQVQVSQIYPYIDDKTISIEVSNFDWDNDGEIKIISIAKNGIRSEISTENNWVKSKFPILDEERNTSLEIQFIKNRYEKIMNNNVVVVVKNQYGEFLPFFVLPIGGIPVYSPKIMMKGID